MKNLLILLLFTIIFASCKSKDGCDATYTDASNQPLPKDLGIVSVNNSTNPVYINIINASCKTLNTDDYTLGNDANQEAFKLPSAKLKSGEQKKYTHSELNFTLTNGETVYLKLKGKIINTCKVN